MKRILFAVAALTFLFAFTTPSFATNGYQLIGIGSTQKGMGGAVTAAPEDAMTAISNPAGMAVIGSRADFNGEAFMPHRQVDLRKLPEGAAPGMGGPGDETTGGSELYGIPSLGWTAPAFGRDDVFFGGGMYATAGLGVDYDTISAGGAFGESDIFTSIQFWKMQPTVAWNVDEKLSLGVGIAFDYQQVEIRQIFRANGFDDFGLLPVNPLPNASGGISLDLSRAVGVYGGGISLGAIYKVNDMVTVGASYISKQWFPDIKYRLGTGAINNFPHAGFLAANTSAGTYRLDLDFPQQLNVGVAVKPMEALTVELDLKWINWEDTHDKVSLSGQRSGAFTLYSFGGMAAGFSTSTTKSIDLNFGWEDQLVVALGARYADNEDLTLRVGYNWAEAPIDEKDAFNNIAFPAVVEQHLTLGFTQDLGDHWSISGSYMKAFSADIVGKNDVPKGFQNLGFGASSFTKVKMDQDALGMQISYRF